MKIETATTADPKDATAEPLTFSTGRRVAVAEAIEALSGEEPARRHRHRDGLRRTTAETAIIMGFPRPT